MCVRWSCQPCACTLLTLHHLLMLAAVDHSGGKDLAVWESGGCALLFRACSVGAP